MANVFSEPRRGRAAEALLVREMDHRWSNDFQLVVGLLALQGRRTGNAEVRAALADAMERVLIVSRARRAMSSERRQSLSAALQRVCEALVVQAEVRGISVHLRVEDEVHGLDHEQITTFALVVNELATNAIKHAFSEAEGGLVRITVGRSGERGAHVTVEDDGRPFPVKSGERRGAGMELAKRLMAAAGGSLTPPPPGTKRFELRIPFEHQDVGEP